MLPILGMSQANSNGEVPKGGNTSSEKQALEIKRNAFYNLEEIKVRWKKAALENCPGVPCPSFSVPGPVTNIVVTPLPSAASVAFLPGSNGGSPITSFIVTATPTNAAPAKRKSSSVITATGTESPILVKGLSPGVNYIFSVVATNAAGGSPSIAFPNPVTPCSSLNTAGESSSEPTVVVNTGSVEISILTRGATGIGTATGLPSGVRASWVDSQIFITGEPSEVGIFNYSIPLTGGCGDVKASGKITVTKAPEITVPNAPVEVIATAGNGFASVAFKAPANNGGSEILDYTVTSNSGTFFVTGKSSPITLELINGISYTFTVVARNAVGSSLPSLASSAVTPLAPACPFTRINDNEDNIYNLVSIGTQCWMKENLRVTKYNDGTVIPLNTSGGQQGDGGTETWSGLKTGAYCVYGNQSNTGNNFENYGYLYNWYAANGVYETGPLTNKNICPQNMHVPSKQEWNILKNYLGGEDQAGGKMKSTSLWITSSTDNNTSGFSALPGGFRVFNSGSFAALEYWAVFQSSTADAFGYPDVFILKNTDSKLLFSGGYEKSVGASVRCLYNQN
jgi:uncharacterized protein (TIGR02145 family)